MNELQQLASTLTAGGAGVWTLVALAVVALIKAWPALKKLQNEADGAMRADLIKMINDLRLELHHEKERCEGVETLLRSEIDRMHGQLHELREQIIVLTRQSVNQIINAKLKAGGQND